MSRLVRFGTGFLAASGIAVVGLGLLNSSGASAAPTCTIYWTGATSTAWASTGNWSLTNGGGTAGATPGPTDYACMSTSPTRAATVLTTSKSIAGINFGAAGSVHPQLEVSGTLTLSTSSSTINNLTLDSSGTLAGAAPLTLTGSSTFASGNTISGAGQKSIASGSSLEIVSGLTIGTSTSNTGSLLNQGTLTIDASTTVSLWTAGASGTAATLVNAATMSLGDQTYIEPAGSGTKQPGFTNSGSLQTPAGATYGQIDTPFTNTGTVTLTSSTLSLDVGNVASTTDTGTVAVSAGAMVNLAGGARTVSAGSVTGAGTLQVTGASVTFGAGVTLSNLDLEGGTVTGSPTVTAAKLASGQLTGSGTLTVPGGGSLIMGGSDIDSGYRVLNHGAATDNTSTYLGCAYGCGGLNETNGGVFENAGTWTITGDGSYSGASDGNAADAVINDAGATITVNLDANANQVSLSAPFTNNGTATLSTGQLYLPSGNVTSTTDTGTAAVAAGTTLIYGGGTRSVSAGSVTGTGTLQVSGATVSFGSGVNLSSLDLESGIVTGSPTVTAAILASGQLTGSGTLTVAVGGSLILAGSDVDSGYRVLNHGAATENTSTYSGCAYGCGGLSETNGAVLENAGTWTITGDGSYSGATDGNAANAILNDAGATMSVNLDANADQVSLSAPFTNNGTLSLSSGQLYLPSGNVTSTTDTGTAAVAAGTTLIYGGGTRTVSAGSVTGSGTLQVSGASVSFGSGVSLSSLDLESGVVTGSPSVTVAMLNGGQLTGSGTLTVPASGSLSLAGSDVDSGYRVLNHGAATDNTSTYVGCGYGCGGLSQTNGGVFENAGTWTITGNGNYSGATDGNPANAILNDAGATITVSLGSAANVWSVYAGLTNDGSINMLTGQYAPPALSNLSAAGALSGGTYVIAGGKFTFPNTVKSNAGSLVLGPTGSFSPALASLTSNSGTLSVAQAVTESGSGGFTNTGTMSVSGAGVIERVNAFAQSTGSLTVGSGATLKSGATGTAAVTISGGSVAGLGTVQGALSASAGSVAPGSSGVGTLAVTGGYSQSGSATLAVNVGSTSTSTSLSVSGTATAGGTLALTTGSGVTPAVGTTFTIVSAGSLSGTFTTVTGQDIGQNYYKVSYTGTSVVLTVTPLPQVSVSAGSVSEGNSGSTDLTLPVSLSAASDRPVSVNWATSNGTATAGSDYTASSGTLTIPAGSTSGLVHVAVSGDTTYERDETVTVTLSTPVHAAIAAGAGSATGTILNDDAPPSVSVAAAGGTTSSSGGSVINFPVTVTGSTAVDLSVHYATSDGTAVAGTDYTAASGTLTIPAGTTSASIPVTVLAKSTVQAPVTFTMTLSTPVDTTIGTGVATGTITNTNSTGGVTVSSVSPSSLAVGISRPVTITGSSFAAGAVVAVSGGGVTVSAVSVVSPTQITATMKPSATAVTGVRNVTVTQGSAVGTCTGCVTVTPKPTITAPSTTSLQPGAVQVLALNSSGVQAGATVKIVNTATKVSVGTATMQSFTASSVTIQFKIKAGTQTGATTVTLTNPDKGAGTCTNCVTITPGPTLTAINPHSIAHGATVSVTITGTNFAAAGVTIKATKVTFTNIVVVNSTTITATATVSSTAAPVSNEVVTLTNAASAGGGVATAAILSIT